MGLNWLPVQMYSLVSRDIRAWPVEVKRDLGSILTKLQKREVVGTPDIASMKTVAQGCFEIRLKDRAGIYRVLYMVESELGIIVFHSFIKKTQTTAKQDIETGRRRLKAFLEELKYGKG